MFGFYFEFCGGKKEMEVDGEPFCCLGERGVGVRGVGGEIGGEKEEYLLTLIRRYPFYFLGEELGFGLSEFLLALGGL